MKDLNELNERLIKIREKVRALEPEQLEAHGMLQHSEDGNWICPECNNGTGEDGTGIEFTATNDGTYTAHCFKCGKSFDIIGIIAAHYGLSPRADFKKVMEYAAEEFKITIDSSTNKNSKGDEKKSKAESKYSKVKRDFSNMISYAQQYLAMLFTMCSTWRGLTIETLRKFRVGYFECFGRDELPYVIIPTISNCHYLARLAMTEEEIIALELTNVKRKPHFGTKDVFNLEGLQNAKADDIFFATEGEIDAMSIVQSGFNAFAFAGCQISKHQLAQLASLSVKPKVIVLFDNDEAGQQNVDKAVRKLQKLGFTAVGRNFIGTFKTEDFEVLRCKDANELLEKSPEALKNYLQTTLDDAVEELENQAHRKSEKAEQESFWKGGGPTSRELFPTCPVDVALPIGYFVREDGVYQLFKSHDPERICNAPIFVSQIQRSNQRDEMILFFVAWDIRHQDWHTFKCKMDDLTDARTFIKILCNNGVSTDMKGASRTARFLLNMKDERANTERIPEKKYFTKTGWLGDDFKEFVYPTDKDGDYYVNKANFNFDKAFDTKGSYQESRQLMRDLIYSSVTSRMVLGAVFAAPLVRPFGVRNPQIHLHAKSGSGKSAVIKAAISAFGDPRILRQTFTNTTKFLQELPAKFNDLPLWIDELQSMDRKTRATVDDQIYNYEGGLTRGRLDKNADDKPQTQFCGVRITSGEQPITTFTSGQGAKNRVIEIDFDNIISSRTAIKIHQMFNNNKKASFGHFGREYVKNLSDKFFMMDVERFYDQANLNIRYTAAVHNGFKGPKTEEAVYSLNDQFIGLIPSHIQMLALFMAALYAFAKSAFADDKEVLKYVQSTLNSDTETFVSEFHTSKISSTADRAFDGLMDIIKSKDKCFQHQAVDGKRTYSQESGNTSLGIIFNDGRVAFYNTPLKNIIKDELGFESPEAVLTGLANLGVLETGNSLVHHNQKCVSYDSLDADGQLKTYRAWMVVFKKNAEEVMRKARGQVKAAS